MNPSDRAIMKFTQPTWLSKVEAYNYVSNPGAGTVLATTGALAAGYYDFTFLVSSNNLISGSTLECQKRDSGDANTTWYFGIQLVGASSFYWRLENVLVGANERYRFYANGAFVGILYTSIVGARRG